MEGNNVARLFDRDEISNSLTDILRAGARQLIMQAVKLNLRNL